MSVIETSEKPVWYTLLMVILSAGIGLVFGSAIGALAGSLLYRGEGDFFRSMQNFADESIWVPLMTMQGMASAFSFFVFPYLAWALIRKKRFGYFSSQNFYFLSLPLVIGIVLLFGIADSAIIEWNQNFHFPDFLKAFETWARAKEDELALATKMLTNFHSPGEFILGFVVIAIVAGICEELLFRGIIQNEFYKGTNNIHIAIWASAFLFSAIHFQFFGFVPRLLLGALFGYLYFWSGNIFVPMLAHTVNNGFSVLMIYLNQQGVVDIDMESTDAVAPWPIIIISGLLGFILLYYFKNFFDQKRELPDGQ
jgi:hypothetical protein